MSYVYALGEEGAVRVVVRHGLFRVILNVYPLLLVPLESFTVEVTVKVTSVPWSLIPMEPDVKVTVRLETEIQLYPESAGEKVSVSV